MNTIKIPLEYTRAMHYSTQRISIVETKTSLQIIILWPNMDIDVIIHPLKGEKTYDPATIKVKYKNLSTTLRVHVFNKFADIIEYIETVFSNTSNMNPPVIRDKDGFITLLKRGHVNLKMETRRRNRKIMGQHYNIYPPTNWMCNVIASDISDRADAIVMAISMHVRCNTSYINEVYAAHHNRLATYTHDKFLALHTIEDSIKKYPITTSDLRKHLEDYFQCFSDMNDLADIDDDEYFF